MTPEDLSDFLKGIDIYSPLQKSGRKAEVSEKYSIVHFLSTYMKDGDLYFPLSVVHRDKPDFLLEMNSLQIGIEHTESTSEQYKWALQLFEEYFPEGFFEPDFFRWGSPKRTRNEILEIISKSQKYLHGDPYFGNSVEKNWVRWMFECIELKTKKLNKVDFEKFSTNYLLIYDNLPQCTNKLELSSKWLYEKLENYWDRKQGVIFTGIIIESRGKLLRFLSNGVPCYKISEIV
ncbi:hypothetical protein KKC87_04190 [Patescibacteria group bacterium]|nr:hypothetical protein [Patescibacteria group bacterium]